MANGYLYALLVTIMAGRVTPFPFESYAMWLAAALLGTSFAVAHEDRAAPSFPNRRSADVVTPPPEK